MADTKISALTALTGANVDTAADVLAIVDTSATATKKIPIDELRNAIGPVLSTEQATTSGTSIDFTNVPSWVKKITLLFAGVSTNGTSELLVQIGDAGGIETSGYLGSTSQISAGLAATQYTTGFGMRSDNGLGAVHGALTLVLEDSANFTWVAFGVLGVSGLGAGETIVTGGSKSTSAALDRVRLTTVNGSDTFDAGAVNILYE